jgi:putative membrane protein
LPLSRPQTIAPASISAGIVLAVGAIMVVFYDIGPQTRHMGGHIVSMNVAAPIFAAFLATQMRPRQSPPALLWLGTLTQVSLVWVWHAPAVYNAAMASHELQFAMHGSLFLAALLFWWSLLTIRTTARWQGIPALLLTGKLVCLLAALIIFAPRLLYDAANHLTNTAGHLSKIPALDDQHLAGLVMITACPLSYLGVAAAIALAIIRVEETPLKAAA